MPSSYQGGNSSLICGLFLNTTLLFIMGVIVICNVNMYLYWIVTNENSEKNCLKINLRVMAIVVPQAELE